MIDPNDPLAGRDAYPQHEIDHLRLHDARQELLEEIVSTPGVTPPVRSAPRWLVPAGIAAAIALVAGGVWITTAGNDDDEPAPATAPSSDVATESPTPSATPGVRPKSKVAPGRIARVCRLASVDGLLESRRDQLDQRQLGATLRRLSKPPPGPGVEVRKGSRNDLYYVVRKGRSWIAVDGDCRVLQTGRGRIGVLQDGVPRPSVAPTPAPTPTESPS